MVIPPYVPLFVASLLHQQSSLETEKTGGGKNRLLVAADVVLTFVLWYFSNGSALCCWRWVLRYARNWVDLPGVASIVPDWTVQGGPLGRGCEKFVEILVGSILVRLEAQVKQEQQSSSSWFLLWGEWGPWPSSWKVWLVVLVLCLLTNVVLKIWSNAMNSRGDHKGVNRMVQSNRSRVLSMKERMQLLGWAFANAYCEEVASRGLWWDQFERTILGEHDLKWWYVNLAQSISFGVWHYHGIPNGWTGVSLTAIYGSIMGVLLHYGGGLLLPVLAHTVADYFIFAVIARGKQKK